MLFSAEEPARRTAVFIAASSALVVATAIGVLAQHVSPAALKVVAGAGFIAIGIWTLARA
jgi:putative Ca2+/H+ antiporter (TMEM165/GDT1 family)